MNICNPNSLVEYAEREEKNTFLKEKNIYKKGNEHVGLKAAEFFYVLN